MSGGHSQTPPYETGVLYTRNTYWKPAPQFVLVGLNHGSHLGSQHHKWVAPAREIDPFNEAMLKTWQSHINWCKRYMKISNRKDRRMDEWSPNHFQFVRQSKIPHGYFDSPSPLHRFFKYVQRIAHRVFK